MKMIRKSSGWESMLALGLAFGLTAFAGGTAAFAQNVEPPFTWKGDGTAWFVNQGAVESLSFKVQTRVEADGTVSGEFSTDDGSATVERLYYGQVENNSRKVILVLTVKTDEDGILYILDGRLIGDNLLYGEVLIKKFEKDGEIEKGLYLGDKTAQEIYPDYLPSGLKKALSTCRPAGCVKVSGGFSQ